MSVIPGTPNPETLPGTPFDDLITAYGGNDTLYGIGGNDTLYGGAGNDSADGGFGNDLIFGEAGDDTLNSGGDSDQLFGGDGNDLIFVNDINYDGESTGYGGEGNDTLVIFGTSHGTAHGGNGIDVLLLGGVSNEALFVDLATQTLDGHGAFPGVTFDGFERLSVLSYAGNDTVLGGALADRIVVGAGSNVVQGKAGYDYIGYTVGEASTLDGGAGKDTLAVTAQINLALHFSVDRVTGAVDDGFASVISTFERYVVAGSNYDDVAIFGGGDDSFQGGRGADQAFGYEGNDTMQGGNDPDLFYGGSGQDGLYGERDNDTLYGDEGNDFIGGGIGDDLVFGGAGNDSIRFYLGDDTVTGGSGQDSFLFTLAQNGVATITDFTSGEDQLRFAALYLQFSPPTGTLDPSRLSIGTATGTEAQFVLVYDPISDTTALNWDTNGADPAGGAYRYAIFTGHVTLSASDFLIV